jgi:hypothetical protein
MLDMALLRGPFAKKSIQLETLFHIFGGQRLTPCASILQNLKTQIVGAILGSADLTRFAVLLLINAKLQSVMDFFWFLFYFFSRRFVQTSCSFSKPE